MEFLFKYIFHGKKNEMTKERKGQTKEMARGKMEAKRNDIKNMKLCKLTFI
jgi:hypothetical protein